MFLNSRANLFSSARAGSLVNCGKFLCASANARHSCNVFFTFSALLSALRLCFLCRGTLHNRSARRRSSTSFDFCEGECPCLFWKRAAARNVCVLGVSASSGILPLDPQRRKLRRGEETMSSETRFVIDGGVEGQLFRQKRLQEKALQQTCLSTCCHFVLAFVVVITAACRFCCYCPCCCCLLSLRFSLHFLSLLLL